MVAKLFIKVVANRCYYLSADICRASLCKFFLKIFHDNIELMSIYERSTKISHNKFFDKTRTPYPANSFPGRLIQGNYSG